MLAFVALKTRPSIENEVDCAVKSTNTGADLSRALTRASWACPADEITVLIQVVPVSPLTQDVEKKIAPNCFEPSRSGLIDKMQSKNITEER
jgi:hypothetical protein